MGLVARQSDIGSWLEQLLVRLQTTTLEVILPTGPRFPGLGYSWSYRSDACRVDASVPKKKTARTKEFRQDFC
jgi:hypothetical protein